MTQRASTSSSRPSGRRAALGLLAAGVLLGACALALWPGRPAQACGWGPDEITDLTTFDPHVLAGAELEGLYYDPFHSGYGPACEDCLRKALLDDWAGYLGPQVPRATWERILFKATIPELDALIFTAKGKKNAAPPPWAPEVARLPRPVKERLSAALYFVGFARRVEPIAQLETDAHSGPSAAALLLKNGDAALARAQGNFLQQRYAFQLLRLRFYQGQPQDAAAFYDASAAKLRGPSMSLAARARHYLAGALLRSGQRPRALLELARVHAAESALAPQVARDFLPRDEAEWQAALALAKDAEEKLSLWTLAGLRHDALVAAEKSFALAPSSSRLALLLVRELTRVEQSGEETKKLEALALQIAATPKADRPWVAWLVAAHCAALRGEVPKARGRVESGRQALAAAKVQRSAAEVFEAQANATLSLALFTDVRSDAKARDEAVTRAAPLPEGFDRKAALLGRLRKRLAAASPPALAELLQPTTTDSPEPALVRWTDPAFVQSVAALVASPQSELEKYAVQNAGYTPDGLKRELAFAQVWKGDFTGAAATLDGDLGPLPSDPLVHGFRDTPPLGAGPSYRVFTGRLTVLEKSSKRPGDEGARAALELGAALYNLTRFAPAHLVLSDTHQYTSDTAPALAWLQQAYNEAKDKELRADVVFQGAKAELAQKVAALRRGREELEVLPVPESWFARLASLEGTSYEKDALRECGHYRRWRARRK